MKIAFLGDAALLVTLADAPGETASAAVHALAAAVSDAHIAGVRALVPAYTTLLVHVEPLLVDLQHVADALAALLPQSVPPLRRRWHLPVRYDGADLPHVAKTLGLSVNRVIDLHATAEYAVACLGFAPGFAYLTGLPPALHIPRRASPRPQIAAGSLILGGQQTAVMPLAMPSGWHLLGRTAVALFDLTQEIPCLLQPGDRVVFVPTDSAALASALPRCEALP